MVASIFNSMCGSSLPASDAEGVLAHPVSQVEAWQSLPPAKVGEGSVLPAWARMLAPHLPGSTAALLELDYAHRVTSPLPAELRAAMRWTSAAANQSTYGQAAATFDAQSAGVSDPRWQSVVSGEHTGWSESERKALTFAHKMSVESHAVSDNEFSELAQAYGNEQAACMVLLMAYSNMQDRLLTCLGATVGADAKQESLAPVGVTFYESAFIVGRTHPAPVVATGDQTYQASDILTADPLWSQIGFEELQQRMELQRKKPTRLPIPTWPEVAVNLPQGLFSEESNIVWYRIVFGYAPQLAVPFERFMRTLAAETSASYDRVFGTSLFWVTTRAVQCPYCMGHCEMNWEVAGLSRGEIGKLSRKLASADWSEFTPRERIAFRFAQKLSQSPGKITREDLENLQHGFGKVLGLYVAVQASRYHYMVRISNGFQLRLESENVFFDYWKKNIPSQETNASTKDISKPTRPFVTLPTNDDAWGLLPKLSRGSQQALPNFVKAFATQLPRTAAAMLELDTAHRLHSPLPPSLRAKQRWVIAKANHCDYSQSYALADLKRAGADEQEVQALLGGINRWSESERKALEFVRLLTEAAPTIPDQLFKDLQHQYGDRNVAAMVLLTAYGNFQDRVILGLNLPLENDGPLAPLDVQFVDGALQKAAILPEKQGTATYIDSGESVVPLDPKWSSISYNELQQRLESQRDRKPRLRIPTWEEAKANLPPIMTSRPTAIRWSLVNYGYAHELAIPWTNATRTHWAECPAERILEESLFWVQTRAIECNYCMGHCEMLLQVAGLDKDQIAKRTKRLAETDWRDFPPSEQRAYAFARKLSQQPWNMTPQDYQSLVNDHGPKKAMGIFWWLCRGLYMTRISDGFQLPLERDNVFQGHAPDEQE